MHIHLASRVAKRLDQGWLNDHVGSLFLGSTAPDIRAMTKWPRERTHFASLSADEVGTGARNMFRLHPELGDQSALSHATQAFLVGYISHLVADEAWITNIYRPHLDATNGQDTATGTKIESNIWDRALQLDMDSKAVTEVHGLTHSGDSLSNAASGVEVAFLNPQSLGEWQEWVHRFLGWEFTWDRLKGALNRMYRDDDDVQREVDSFLRDMPGSLEKVYESIPREKIDAYQQGALEQTLAQVQKHWGGDAIDGETDR